MSNEDDHLRRLNSELDALRGSLVALRRQVPLSRQGTPRTDTLETATKHFNGVKTLVRLLQGDAAENRTRLERAEREVWDQKVRRADATARLKRSEQLLEKIQRSAAWKVVKPIWKLFNRSRKQADQQTEAGNLAFAIDLPKQWKTSREVVLIKGWCFSTAGKPIAGIRVRTPTKTKLARYGLERLDVAGSFPDNPAARRSGFTVELPVLSAKTKVRFETIEQGSEWRPFLERELLRDLDGEADLDFDEVSGEGNQAQQKVLKLSSLSASKAFGLIQPGFQQQARRVTAEKPLVSVITPTYNSKPEWLAEAALSLLNQSFANWEWCIVDDASDNRETKKLLELLAGVSPRVRVTFAARTGISATTNAALDLAQGAYVCFLDHDDLLHPFALASMEEKLRAGFDVVYSDEDKVEDATGNLVEPFFKPDWSPEYFRGAMYVGHLLCVRRELAAQTRFDSAFDGVQDFEFLLRLSETNPRIGHIPRILYHWRKTPGSIAERTDAKPQIGALQQRAVNAHLQRLNLPATAEQSPLPHRLQIIPMARQEYARISIIIPSRDAPDVLGRCLKSLFEKTSYPNFEVIVMDNETRDERALALMQEYPVRQIPFPNPFNFSRANNQGAAAATGELLVFLNNDTEIIAEDWLQHLAYYAGQSDVGAAGALLAYDDRTVQHAGVALGMRGTADHTMRRFPITADGYAGNLACAREVSVVTGACLMVRKAVFEEIGGFNEHFFTAYQDVDLCLRLRARGLRVICTPRALLLHHEFVSRPSYYYDIIDRMLLLDQWEELIERGDPYYNPNLDLDRGDYSRRSA